MDQTDEMCHLYHFKPSDQMFGQLLLNSDQSILKIINLLSGADVDYLESSKTKLREDGLLLFKKFVLQTAETKKKKKKIRCSNKLTDP